jgi:hypothetical protein
MELTRGLKCLNVPKHMVEFGTAVLLDRIANATPMDTNLSIVA